MTEKELRRLGRGDLLNLLLEQSLENQRLREQLESAQSALADRTLCIERAGSIAEASLQLSGVFKATEEACQQYTDNNKRLSLRQEEICAQRDRESREKAAQLIEATQKQCAEMLEQAKQESQKYWEVVSAKLAAISNEHEELRQLLAQLPVQNRGEKQ